MFIGSQIRKNGNHRFLSHIRLLGLSLILGYLMTPAPSSAQEMQVQELPAEVMPVQQHSVPTTVPVPQNAPVSATNPIQETFNDIIEISAIESAIWLGLWTIVCACTIALLSYFRIKVTKWLTTGAKEKTQNIKSTRIRLLSLRYFFRIIRTISFMVYLLLCFAVVYFWLIHVLKCFGASYELGHNLELALLNELLTFGKQILKAFPGICLTIVILLLVRAIDHIIVGYFQAVEDGEVESNVFDSATAVPTRRVLRFTIWIICVLIVFPYIPGSDTAAFRGISVLAGLAFSIGSTSFIKQITGGLVITYSNIARPGDYIRVGEQEGTILGVGVFSTKIRTPKQEIIYLTNSALTEGIVNYSRNDAGRCVVRFGTKISIGYDVAWSDVSRLMIKAADSIDGVAKSPKPEVFQRSLEDFYICYELLYSVTSESQNLRITSAVNAAILDQFNQAGIQIMSPHYMADPAELKIVSPKSDSA